MIAGLLAVVAVIAWVRSGRVRGAMDPMIALRHEQMEIFAYQDWAISAVSSQPLLRVASERK